MADIPVKYEGLFHVINTAVFERRLLDELCSLATRVRAVAKTRAGARSLQELGSNKRAMLYFTEPSTRTFLSFNTLYMYIYIYIYIYPSICSHIFLICYSPIHDKHSH